jgi:hypothetical protein
VVIVYEGSYLTGAAETLTLPLPSKPWRDSQPE